MDWRRLDLNLLKILELMLKERSVARTAEKLCVTPSAVSHALRRLRQAFNDPLFIRSGTEMIPTARASALEETLAIFTIGLDRHLDAPASGTKPFNPSQSRQVIRIVAPGAVELSLIPSIVQEFRASAPRMSVAVEPFERRSYEADLISGRAHFIFAVGGYTPNTADIDSIVAREDELVILAGPKSKLYDEPGTIRVEDYLSQPQMYPLPWPVMQNHLDAVLARNSQRRVFALSTSSYCAMGEVLAATDVIASLPDHTAEVIMRRYPELRSFRMWPPRRSKLMLHWSLSALRDPAINWAKGVIARSVAHGVKPTTCE